jgi:hypothetical protein
VAGFVSVRGRIALHRLESVPGALKREYRPLRFMLLSRSDASVSARFFLYDADGREIAAFERSWNGYELDVDTALVPGESGGLAFPVRVSRCPPDPAGARLSFGTTNGTACPASPTSRRWTTAPAGICPRCTSG